jgi:hypothetical protein
MSLIQPARFGAAGQYIVKEKIWEVSCRYQIPADGFVGSGSYGTVVRAHRAGNENVKFVIKRTENVLHVRSAFSQSCCCM